MKSGDVTALVKSLRAEATRANQRRLLVLAGDREATYRAARRALDVADPAPESVSLVGERDVLGRERVTPARSGELLGTTREVIVVDAHDRLDPNALGRVVGAVDGGGLLVLLVPPLAEWPRRTDGFDETLAVPPYAASDVSGHFRRRLVDTLRTHPGVAVVDADAGEIEYDGLTDPPPAPPVADPTPPEGSTFPEVAYEACLTGDQADAVAAFEDLFSETPPRAVVVEADRGRGKSSAAGLAAGAMAAAGAEVLVTAPEFRSARELFARAAELLAELGDGNATGGDPPRTIRTPEDGGIRYLPPADAVEAADDVDVCFVDEAAALPVHTLEGTLDADRVAYATTVHGYEGAGRGFSVRFRDRLAESDHAVTEVGLDEPIRYARDDPVESWGFRALALDARPPVDQVVEDATTGSVEYRALDAPALVEDEHLLRETFGLLVLAHYRTEPDDLARMLDAPNVAVRALTHGGHVVSVALLAREGDLPAEVRRETYDGARIRGHMLPDVLVSQLRDEAAGVPEGLRVMRIATHHAVRSRGLGSQLLERVRAEFEDDVDWLGTGFGATPGLLSFWRANGYRTVHLSVTRNDRSGEHSALMLLPTSEAGDELTERHTEWFADRVAAMLSDPLSEVDPDVVRATLGSIGTEREPALSERGWRVVAGAAYGPGLFKVDPGPFRDLVVAHLVDPVDPGALSDRQERLLVALALQGRDADAVAERLEYHSTGQCLRAVGDALAVLCDCYGGDVAREERERYR